MSINLCPPAIIYLIFSITQIIIDVSSGLFNTALVKSIVTIMVTYLLNILCNQGLTIISWIIVFLPFIFMTVIVSMLLYIFGLDVATGKIKHITKNRNINNDIHIDSLGNIIVYDPTYNPIINPVYYKYPNIIIPIHNSKSKII